MSDDYSSFERDYFRKSKHREDLKPQKSNSKQVKVYEPKSSQKPIKSQGYADEPEYPPRYDNDYQDNYSNQTRNDTYKSYVSKTPSASKSKQGENSRVKTWKKDAVKTNRNTGESQKDKSHKQITEWVPLSKNTLFFEEKPAIMANNSNPKALPAEVKHSSGEDSSMTSAGHSTNGTNEGRKSIEVFDFSHDRPDPIQALKTKMRKESQNENRDTKRKDSKEEENKEEKILDEVNNLMLKEENNKRMCDGSGPVDETGEEAQQEEDNYSDIDARMEKKLLNNEVELHDDSDLFHQAAEPKMQDHLEALEDNKRPVWEDIDTNKVLEDIKKFDHISLFSQDIKKSPWGDKRFESRQSGQNILQLTQLREGEKPYNQKSNEEDDDYFDRIFSLKVLEEPKAFASDVFKIWGKASSDKQFTDVSDTVLAKNISSHSFELDKNHTSLPAFRSCHLQKSHSANNNDITGDKNDLLRNDKQIRPMNMNNQSNVFKNLIPNCDAKIWFYKDLQGVLQGPFSSRMMDDWHSKGYLPLDLDITIGNSNRFRKIRELAEIAENNKNSTQQGNQGQNNNYSYPQHNGNSQYSQSAPMKFDNTKNVKSPLSNMMCENSCPNVRTYNFSPNQSPNSFSMPSKPITNTFTPNCASQSFMSRPLFNSDFSTYKEANRNQMIPSAFNNANKIAYTNQIEANSNQIRNLPR